MLIKEAIGSGSLDGMDGYILNEAGHEVMDLGDDMYTQGKPHLYLVSVFFCKKFKKTMK